MSPLFFIAAHVTHGFEVFSPFTRHIAFSAIFHLCHSTPELQSSCRELRETTEHKAPVD